LNFRKAGGHSELKILNIMHCLKGRFPYQNKKKKRMKRERGSLNGTTQCLWGIGECSAWIKAAQSNSKMGTEKITTEKEELTFSSIETARAGGRQHTSLKKSLL